MKFLFIHACVTLKYFNLKRQNEFKRFVVYIYCFSDIKTAVERVLEEMRLVPFKGSLDL